MRHFVEATVSFLVVAALMAGLILLDLDKDYAGPISMVIMVGGIIATLFRGGLLQLLYFAIWWGAGLFLLFGVLADHL